MHVRKQKMEAQLKKLQAEMGSIGPLIRGSIVSLRIGTSKKKYPSLYFSVNMNGKTKLIYLGEKRLALAKRLNQNYLKLRRIIVSSNAL